MQRTRISPKALCIENRVLLAYGLVALLLLVSAAAIFVVRYNSKSQIYRRRRRQDRLRKEERDHD